MLQQNKGVLSFRNDPLKHIDLHHAVFSGRTVVGNHSAVAGAAPQAPQGAVQWQTIDMAQLAAAYRPPPPTPPPTAADRGKGKRPAANTPASGSSSKKSRSDSAGLALERIADIRQQSYQSRVAQMEAEKSMGLDACMELVENDGHEIGGSVWYAACALFRDPLTCKCFVRLKDAARRLEFIRTGGTGQSSGGTKLYFTLSCDVRCFPNKPLFMFRTQCANNFYIL